MIYQLTFELNFLDGEKHVVIIPVNGADLTGSEKQIAYARDLIRKYCETRRMLIKFPSETDLQPFYDGDPYAALSEYYADRIQTAAAAVLTETNAHKIIEMLQYKV